MADRVSAAHRATYRRAKREAEMKAAKELKPGDPGKRPFEILPFGFYTRNGLSKLNFDWNLTTILTYIKSLMKGETNMAKTSARVPQMAHSHLPVTRFFFKYLYDFKNYFI